MATRKVGRPQRDPALDVEACSTWVRRRDAIERKLGAFPKWGATLADDADDAGFSETYCEMLTELELATVERRLDDAQAALEAVALLERQGIHKAKREKRSRASGKTGRNAPKSFRLGRAPGLVGTAVLHHMASLKARGVAHGLAVRKVALDVMVFVEAITSLDAAEGKVDAIWRRWGGAPNQTLMLGYGAHMEGDDDFEDLLNSALYPDHE